MYIAPSLKEMYENRAKINAKLVKMTPEQELAYFNRQRPELEKLGIKIVASAKKA